MMKAYFFAARLASKTEWVFLKKTLPPITFVELRIVGVKYEFVAL